MCSKFFPKIVETKYTFLVKNLMSASISLSSLELVITLTLVFTYGVITGDEGSTYGLKLDALSCQMI